MTTPLSVQRVVVAVDDPDRRYVAVSIARDLAHRLSATVDRVTVATGHHGGSCDPVTPTTRMIEGISETTRTVTGRSAEATLAEIAHDHGVLMCVAASAHRALVESVTGSTSASIVRHSRRPVVLVGPRCELHVRGSQMAIAVDGSSDAESIVEPAVALAEALGLMPVIVQVTWADVASILDVNDTSYVAALASRVARPDQPISYDVFHAAHPHGALRMLAESRDTAMIAMATHALAPLERLVMPSRTIRVLRHARCPVLLSRRALQAGEVDHGAGPRVVAGIDGSSSDADVLVNAVAEAERRNAVLEIVYAWTPEWFSNDGGVAFKSEAGVRAAQAIIDRGIATVRTHSSSVAVRPVLMERRPIEAILDAAVGAEMVVIGEHHHGVIERSIFGSTTEAVLRGASVPVVVVPTRDDTTPG